MTLFKQNSQFSWPITVREPIAVARENRNQKFSEWLAVPRYCPKHPRTRLVQRTSPKPNHIGATLSYVDTDTDDEFTFCADFCCPACLRAFALFPPEFLQSGFDTFQTDTEERAAALATARAYVAQVNQFGVGFLVFVGMPGTGKTMLSAGIVGELRGLKALYVRQGELITALRATYGADKYEYDEFGRKEGLVKTPLEITQAAGLLILDEIGCTAPANDERLLLDELLKHRFEQRKPTILISNLPLKLLNKYLGHALADRIHQATGGGKFIFTFIEESYRQGDGDNYLRGLG